MLLAKTIKLVCGKRRLARYYIHLARYSDIIKGYGHGTMNPMFTVLK